jgi:hypothetical protein
MDNNDPIDEFDDELEDEGGLKSVLSFFSALVSAIFTYEPALQPESGYNFNDDCNPLEYDCLGRPVERTAEDLGIITEYEEALLEIMRPEMEVRRELNRKRKLAVDEETFKKFPCYSDKEIKHLLEGFSILDENDDYLIDRIEFIMSLEHFNDAAGDDTDKEKELKLFDHVDESKEGVLDFEKYLRLCAYAEGHVEIPSDIAGVIKDSSFAKYIECHNLHLKASMSTENLQAQ